MAHIPTARGLAVCEQVIIEEGTKNVTLVNCFTGKRARRFPAEEIKFVVFAFLSAGEGEINIEVNVESLTDFTAFYQRFQRLQLVDRMVEVRFIYRINECVFPEPGHYQVNLLAEGEILAQQRILISITE
jgi:hypothetical protein